jgi:hypothetical protein
MSSPNDSPILTRKQTIESNDKGYDARCKSCFFKFRIFKIIQRDQDLGYLSLIFIKKNSLHQKLENN